MLVGLFVKAIVSQWNNTKVDAKDVTVANRAAIRLLTPSSTEKGRVGNEKDSVRL